MYWSSHVGPWASWVERICRATVWGVSLDPGEDVAAKILETDPHHYLDSDRPVPLTDLIPQVWVTLFQNPRSKLGFFCLTNTL